MVLTLFFNVHLLVYSSLKHSEAGAGYKQLRGVYQHVRILLIY